MLLVGVGLLVTATVLIHRSGCVLTSTAVRPSTFGRCVRRSGLVSNVRRASGIGPATASRRLPGCFAQDCRWRPRSCFRCCCRFRFHVGFALGLRLPHLSMAAPLNLGFDTANLYLYVYYCGGVSRQHRWRHRFALEVHLPSFSAAGVSCISVCICSRSARSHSSSASSKPDDRHRHLQYFVRL
ncbi:MAG: hypothetical protein MZU97_16410 [Bacillus subtilis]|nr:hypothetical protein [Bacillus subtilis]